MKMFRFAFLLTHYEGKVFSDGGTFKKNVIK
jgi:hypothetical protein